MRPENIIILPVSARVAHTAGGAYVPTLFVGMYAAREHYNLPVSALKHYYGLNHLHYVTTSTYRRARLFDSERFKRRFVSALDDLRRELDFRIVGYVLMCPIRIDYVRLPEACRA